MPAIKYVGPHTEVYVPALAAYVERGGTVQVDDRDLVAGLLEQPENWQPVGASSRSARNAPAPEPGPEPDPDPAQAADPEPTTDAAPEATDPAAAPDDTEGA